MWNSARLAARRPAYTSRKTQQLRFRRVKRAMLTRWPRSATAGSIGFARSSAVAAWRPGDTAPLEAVAPRAGRARGSCRATARGLALVPRCWRRAAMRLSALRRPPLRAPSWPRAVVSAAQRRLLWMGRMMMPDHQGMSILKAVPAMVGLGVLRTSVARFGKWRGGPHGLWGMRDRAVPV